MTNITDEQILKFIRAKKVWVWTKDPNEAVRGEPDSFHIRGEHPFEISRDDCDCIYHVGRHFSLEKPQVYVDRAWYTATTFQQDVDICCHYDFKLNLFICDGYRYNANQLTNIRRIPKELWEGDG